MSWPRPGWPGKRDADATPTSPRLVCSSAPQERADSMDRFRDTACVGARRPVLALLGAALLGPAGLRAQDGSKAWRIAFLAAGSAPRPGQFSTFDAITAGLRERGYGALQTRAWFADGRTDALPALAQHLLAWQPDVIVTNLTPATLAQFVVARNWLSADRAGRIASEARDRSTVHIASHLHGTDMEGLVRHLRATGHLTAGLILRTLLSGNLDLFYCALAELSGMPSLKSSLGSTFGRTMWVTSQLTKVMLRIDAGSRVSAIPRSQDPAVAQEQLTRTAIELLRSECAAGPLVLVLEDLHWADAASLRILDAALRLFATNNSYGRTLDETSLLTLLYAYRLFSMFSINA